MSLPSHDDILKFLQEYHKPATKREMSRVFRIRGDDRRPFREILRKMVKKELIIKHEGGAYSIPASLPSVTIIEVTTITLDGDAYAHAQNWNEGKDGPSPMIELLPDKGHQADFTEGDRVLARIKRLEDGSYEARAIRRLDTPDNRILGVVTKQRKGFVLSPVDKKAKYSYDIEPGDIGEAQEGDYAIGEIQPTRRGIREKNVRIIDIIGHEADPKSISLISAHEAGLHDTFPAAVIAETKDMEVPELGKREDLRGMPLVTIDGLTAKDFDDAVFAEECDEGGYHLIVAIADVSYYVRPETALDIEAYRRGNSTYFPDRVIPMLPERLSNDLCSLRPDEDRACLAAHIWIDNEGKMQRHKFVRALMRSHARLIYEQVQAAKDGQTDDITAPLMDHVINPLYKVYELLNKQRLARHALELDLPEREIILDENGAMKDVRTRARLDAHKLIEEFMILANVAAAQALEAKKAPCVYRVHETPDASKIENVRNFVEAFGLSFPRGQVIRGRQINELLLKSHELPYSHLISEVILRSQSQAHYSTNNKGHFGLALDQYGHFTSPIRRYSDLLVHRSLVDAYSLGKGGLSDEEQVMLEERCEHISETERISISAERRSLDRFIASFLADKVGAEFEGRITGVTKHGLFVQLPETGADGLVPIRTLPDDYYEHIEDQHALIGKRTGRIYRLGASLTVKLEECVPVTGGMIMSVVGKDGADIPGLSFKSNPSQGRRNDKGSKSYKKRSSYKKGRNSPAKPYKKNKGGSKNFKKGSKKKT